MIDDGPTRVLLAVIDGHAATTTISRATGIPRTTVWLYLNRLRRAGLVDWDEGRAATIHPTVRRTA